MKVKVDSFKVQISASEIARSRGEPSLEVTSGYSSVKPWTVEQIRG